MSQILITGGCGLVGFNACKYYAERGHNVISVDNLSRSSLLGHEVSEKRRTFNRDQLKVLGVENLLLDVADPQLVKALPQSWCDSIIHLAGQCSVPNSISDPRKDFEVNTAGTFNILEYARSERNKGRATKVAFSSTNKVYNLHSGWMLQGDRWRWTSEAWHRNGFPADMTSSLLKGSRTPYGNSKFMADAMMQEWFHMFNVPTGIFRMSCIYGKNQFSFSEQGWAVFFQIAALKDLPITIYGDGKQVRDMLYVEDLVKAYDAFLTSTKIHNGVWNIGGGPHNALSLNECLDMIREKTGKPIPVTFADWRPSDQRVYTSDITNFIHDFGWRPTVTPKEGLDRTFEWVKENIDVF
jgi:CDP-paratose 2-epimerase